MPRVSDDWIRDEIGNCPPDDGEWQAKMNSALSEVLLSRRVIEAVRRHAHYGCCVETWQDVAEKFHPARSRSSHVRLRPLRQSRPVRVRC